jgi:hypothetical protein
MFSAIQRLKVCLTYERQVTALLINNLPDADNNEHDAATQSQSLQLHSTRKKNVARLR